MMARPQSLAAGQPHPGPSRIRRRLNDLALLLVVLIVGLGLMELGARWVVSDVGTTGESGSYMSRQWYAEHPPRLNALGFRGRDFTPEPPPGVFRIAAVGDSFTQGSGIIEPKRVSNRIEAALNARNEGRFEVVNFGQSGAGYEQNEANLRLAIRTARPHFILLQWYLNDLDDPTEKRPRPRQLGGVFHRELNAGSALYMLAARVFADTQVRLGIVPVDAYYARFANPDDPIARRADARLRRVINAARSAGVPIGLYAWPELTRPLGTSPNDVLIDRLMATCQAEGIECVDLRAVLTSEPDHQRLIVNRFDTHGSGYANALATRLLLERFGPEWRKQGDMLTAAEAGQQPSEKATERDP